MIQISFWKVMLVLIIALLVIGPKELPKIAEVMGRLIGGLRKSLSLAQREWKAVASEIENTTTQEQNPKEK